MEHMAQLHHMEVKIQKEEREIQKKKEQEMKKQKIQEFKLK